MAAIHSLPFIVKKLRAARGDLHFQQALILRTSGNDLERSAFFEFLEIINKA